MGNERETSTEELLMEKNGKKFRATPLARRLAEEKGLDLSVIRGSGPRGRVTKDDVITFSQEERRKWSPLAKRIAEEEGINLSVLKGTGPKGRIMKADVLRAIRAELPEEEPVKKEEVRKEAPAPEAKKDEAKDSNRWGDIETLPMSPMRKVIARRMTESYFSVPSFIVDIEVDMTKLLSLRKEVTDHIVSQTGKKPTVTDFINFGVIHSLMKHPMVNSSLSEDGSEILLHHYVNLGIAVGKENGLLVPVVKGANKMSLTELVLASKEVIQKAQENKLTPADMAESTFTVSNLGMFGVKSFVPIINQPNSAILGISATIEKPVVVNGEITVRPIMTLTLTADHRVIDGMEGALFMQTLKKALENPMTLLV